MKVLIVNHYAYAPFQHGGVRHFMLAKELQRLGHETLIVSTSFFHKSQSETRLEPGEKHRLETIDGVRFLWLKTPPYKGNGVGRIRNMLSFAWQVLRRSGFPSDFAPDVVYSSSPQLLSSLAAERLARKLGVPHVFEIRDLWPQTFVDLGNWSPSHPWIRMLDLIQRHLYRRADHVVSTLPSAAPYIVEHGGRKEAITWITNGIDLREAPEPKPLADNGRPFVLAHAGVHAVSTGLDAALDAAGILIAKGRGADIEFVFWGSGPEKARQLNRIENEGLTNVVFHDPVPKSEIHDKLAVADGFLLTRAPSPIHRWGISPHKLADYFAAKRPVVFSVDSEWNPVAEVNAGTTALPGDAASLADAIVRLVDTPVDERRSMAERGYDFMKSEMEIRILGSRLERVLKSVVIDTRSQGIPGS